MSLQRATTGSARSAPGSPRRTGRTVPGRPLPFSRSLSSANRGGWRPGRLELRESGTPGPGARRLLPAEGALKRARKPRRVRRRRPPRHPAGDSRPRRARGSRPPSPPPATTYLPDRPADTGSARDRIRKLAREARDSACAGGGMRSPAPLAAWRNSSQGAGGRGPAGADARRGPGLTSGRSRKRAAGAGPGRRGPPLWRRGRGGRRRP